MIDVSNFSARHLLLFQVLKGRENVVKKSEVSYVGRNLSSRRCASANHPDYVRRGDLEVLVHLGTQILIEQRLQLVVLFLQYGVDF